MKLTGQQIRKQRKFTVDFKKEIVKDFESGKYSVSDLMKLHNIAGTQIYNWIYKYSTVNKKGYRVVEMKESSELKVKELEQKVRELERIVGSKQIKIDFLEKMIELAKTDLDIDIKKNYSTPQSNGLGNTQNK